MDNDPSRTSKVALLALRDIECNLHRIPPRSPDLNPIENIFHIVKKQLEDEALNLHITNELFQDFRDRVYRCLDSLDIETINRTILSMPRRIEKIIANRGIRLKYWRNARRIFYIFNVFLQQLNLLKIATYIRFVRVI